jgi:hypothetical protein
MRYPSIRSVLRTAIAFGVVASYQSSLYASSWMELLQSNSSVCFFHDLNWDHSPAARSSVPKSSEFDEACFGARTCLEDEIPCESSRDQLAAELLNANEQETLECIRASEAFEIRSNAIAVWRSVGIHSYSWIRQSHRLFSTFGIARSTIIDAVQFGTLKLVEWVQIPNSLPLTTLANVIDSDGFDVAAEEAYDHGQECVPVGPSRFPARSQANLFVFTLDTSELDYDDSDNGLASLDSSIPDESDSVNLPADDSSDSELLPVNAWQVGIDPVCPDIHGGADIHVRYDSAAWSEVSTEPKICCPINNRDCEGVAESFVATTYEPIRPPTLESDTLPTISSWQGKEGLGHCEVPAPLAEEIHVAGELVDESFGLADDGPLDHEARLFGTDKPLQCFPWTRYRSHMDGSGLRISDLSSPIGMYSREDVLAESNLPERWLSQSDITSVDAAQDSVPSISSENSSASPKILPFSALDLLTLDYETAWNSLSVQLSETREQAFNFASKLLKQPSHSDRLNASKELAKQIRSVGDFLIDFAGRIEVAAERVAIAKRDISQR